MRRCGADDVISRLNLWRRVATRSLAGVQRYTEARTIIISPDRGAAKTLDSRAKAPVASPLPLPSLT